MQVAFHTPVLLITFNRPEHTRRVLGAILAAKPKDLYVFQDGPREGNEKDAVKCTEVRRVVEELTKGSDVVMHTNYSDKNLGCGRGPATGVTWFFENVEEGMVFEDDCLPSSTLFFFYEELLKHYRNDTRVSIITGTNALSKWRSTRHDFVIAKHGGMTMGCWASWRRAWKLFDYEVKTWGSQEYKDQLRKNVGKKGFAEWKMVLDRYYANPPSDVWDYQWAYARELYGTYSIVSTVNQMSNIGFGEESTHTPDTNDCRSNMETFLCRIPLRPRFFRRDRLFEWVMYQRFSRTSKKTSVLRCLLKTIDLIWRR